LGTTLRADFLGGVTGFGGGGTARAAAASSALAALAAATDSGVTGPAAAGPSGIFALRTMPPGAEASGGGGTLRTLAAPDEPGLGPRPLGFGTNGVGGGGAGGSVGGAVSGGPPARPSNLAIPSLIVWLNLLTAGFSLVGRGAE